MISLAIWCVKHLKIFQRLQIVPVLRVWAILIYLKKITRAYLHQIAREIMSILLQILR